MGVDLAPMSVEDFFAFAETRPDEERWELIDGTPVLNASPAHLHQRILANLFRRLSLIELERGTWWEVIPSIGVRVSHTSLPVPDLIVRPRGAPGGDPKSGECDDIIVAFDILSPSTADRDLRWKRTAYTRLPSLTHYVVIAQDDLEVRVYDRAAGYHEHRLLRLDAMLELGDLAISIALSEIYRDTGLADV